MGTFDAFIASPDASLEGRELAPLWRRFAAGVLDVLLLIVPAFLFQIVVAILFILVALPSIRAFLFEAFTEDFDDERAAVHLAAVIPVLLDNDVRVPCGLEMAYLQGGGALAEALVDVDLGFQLGTDDTVDPSTSNEVLVPVFALAPGWVGWLSRFGLAASYFVLLGSGGRRTVGQWLFGVEVVRLEGRPMHLHEAFQRFLGLVVLVGGVIGLVAMTRERNGRGSHDRIANTVVLRS